MSFINVLYASDDRYAPVLSVSIRSLLHASKNAGIIRIYIIDDGISEGNKKVLEDIVSHFKSTVWFRGKYDFSKFEDISFTTDRGSLTQYARLFISDLMPKDIDRVLYIDCDTLVLQDIGELYNTDLDGAIVAGVEDAFSKNHWSVLGLDNKSIYINSGLVLIDLNMWRKNRIEDRFKEQIIWRRGRFLQGDQGLINSVLCGHVYKLPLKYNMVSYLYDFTYEEMQIYRRPYNYYSGSEVIDAKRKPVIIHFTSSFASMRPWQRSDCEHIYAYLWKKYYEQNGYQIKDVPYKITYNLYNLLPHKIILQIIGIIHIYIKPCIWGLYYKMIKGEDD